jgi:hypothetical protein
MLLSSISRQLLIVHRFSFSFLFFFPFIRSFQSCFCGFVPVLVLLYPFWQGLFGYAAAFAVSDV